MLFRLDARSNTPIWEQIVNQVKESLLKGLLTPGDKLPSVRELAATLIVNPNTVSKAYQELERQEIIETLRGKGTFICTTLKVTVDEKKIAILQEKTKQLVIEGSYLGISTKTLIEWIQLYEKEMEGKKRD